MFLVELYPKKYIIKIFSLSLPLSLSFSFCLEAGQFVAADLVPNDLVPFFINQYFFKKSFVKIGFFASSYLLSAGVYSSSSVMAGLVIALDHLFTTASAALVAVLAAARRLLVRVSIAHLIALRNTFGACYNILKKFCYKK